MHSPGTLGIVKAVPTFSEVRIGGPAGIGGACDEQRFAMWKIMLTPAWPASAGPAQAADRPRLAAAWDTSLRRDLALREASPES